MHTPTILPATCGACFSEVSILFLRLFGSMKMSLCVSNREQVSSSQPPQTRKLCQVHALVAQCPLLDDDWIRARMWKNNRSPPSPPPLLAADLPPCPIYYPGQPYVHGALPRRAPSPMLGRSESPFSGRPHPLFSSVPDPGPPYPAISGPFSPVSDFRHAAEHLSGVPTCNPVEPKPHKGTSQNLTFVKMLPHNL